MTTVVPRELSFISFLAAFFDVFAGSYPASGEGKSSMFSTLAEVEADSKQYEPSCSTYLD